MKRYLKIVIGVTISICFCAIFHSCTKDKEKEPTLPVLSTATISGITTTEAISGGTITSDGGSAVTACGVCWSTTENPTTASTRTTDGAGSGSFTSSLTGLAANTHYFVRAYATNSAGTAYGNQLNFTSAQSPGIIGFNPDLTYGTLTDIEGNEYKTITIGSQTWMAENLKTTKYNDGSDVPSVTDNSLWFNLTTPAYSWYENDNSKKDIYGALYNWYAVNRGNLCPAGWHIPTDAEWTILSTYLGGESIAGGKLKETGTAHWNPNTDASNSSGFTALPGGMRGNGGYFFDMGYYSGYWWSATESWGRTIYCRSADISSLTDNNTAGYSVRCVQGDPEPATLPTVTTSPVANVTTSTAISGGVVKSNAGASITSRGVCWSTSENPTIADQKTTDDTGAGHFESQIAGLSANTTYYVRAYAINVAGTAYGDQMILKTMTGTVTDIDGNVYKTVTIGDQLWMAENLKSTRYQNGDVIPDVADDNTWFNLATGARCTNNYIDNYSSVYGLLYNWYAASDIRNICPTGWHVPSDNEWTALTTYLGDAATAGGKLKEVGTSHWIDPNAEATNETGFTALPDGWRGPYGFSSALDWGFWWSATESDATVAWHIILFTYDPELNRSANDKKNGFSVRCLKD
jgi:uncharacterized protein (TIGR02145 family)